MFPKVNPVSTKAWKALTEHKQKSGAVHMKELFASDPDRFKKYSFALNDILVDFSKNIVTDETLGLLFDLANESKLKEAIEAMFSGEMINETEHRSVLHIALRNFSGKPVYSEGKDVMPDVKKCYRTNERVSATKYIVANGKVILEKNKIHCEYWYWWQ